MFHGAFGIEAHLGVVQTGRNAEHAAKGVVIEEDAGVVAIVFNFAFHVAPCVIVVELHVSTAHAHLEVLVELITQAHAETLRTYVDIECDTGGVADRCFNHVCCVFDGRSSHLRCLAAGKAGVGNRSCGGMRCTREHSD